MEGAGNLLLLVHHRWSYITCLSTTSQCLICHRSHCKPSGHTMYRCWRAACLCNHCNMQQLSPTPPTADMPPTGLWGCLLAAGGRLLLHRAGCQPCHQLLLVPPLPGPGPAAALVAVLGSTLCGRPHSWAGLQDDGNQGSSSSSQASSQAQTQSSCIAQETCQAGAGGCEGHTQEGSQGRLIGTGGRWGHGTCKCHQFS